ncbi:MAG: hypothetical protein HYV18_06920, partial [Gammaproteobacteria bacterium]|nr:hypothetical protein [Gammaproteobacteria bacterium]
APFPDVQEIFRGTLPAVLGYRELDHYEVERPEPYRGLPDYSYGEAPFWPAGSGPKVFAYLRPIAQLDKVLEGLKRAPARVLLRISGVPPDRLRPYLRPGFAVVEKPIGFRLAAESCDAFVNYSAFSTVGEFLLAGKPGVLVPDLHERLLVARRAVGLGAALAVRGQGIANFGPALRRVLEEPSFRQAAERFAASARAVPRDKILPQLVDEALRRVG